MDVSLSTALWHEADGDWLIVGVTESPDLSGPLSDLDEALSGALSRLIEAGDVK